MEIQNTELKKAIDDSLEYGIKPEEVGAFIVKHDTRVDEVEIFEKLPTDKVELSTK